MGGALAEATGGAAAATAHGPGEYTGRNGREALARQVGRCLRQVNLETVLIGNAAAALQGAPVTTVDFDFLFRRTPRNLRKLKGLARALDATILRPYYPASDL